MIKMRQQLHTIMDKLSNKISTTTAEFKAVMDILDSMITITEFESATYKLLLEPKYFDLRDDELHILPHDIILELENPDGKVKCKKCDHEYFVERWKKMHSLISKHGMDKFSELLELNCYGNISDDIINKRDD